MNSTVPGVRIAVGEVGGLRGEMCLRVPCRYTACTIWLYKTKNMI